MQIEEDIQPLLCNVSQDSRIKSYPISNVGMLMRDVIEVGIKTKLNARLVI